MPNLSKYDVRSLPARAHSLKLSQFNKENFFTYEHLSFAAGYDSFGMLNVGLLFQQTVFQQWALLNWNVDYFPWMKFVDFP